MEFKIVETSLNLRVERKFGKKNKDYLLSKDVAEEQLKLGADVYCNVIIKNIWKLLKKQDMFLIKGWIPITKEESCIW